MAQSVQVISLKSDAAGQPILNERLAGAAGILPGHLVEEASGEVVVHSTAAGMAQRLFAQTNLAVAGDIDTAYTDGVTVSYGAYHAGQEVNALVAAGAVAIADGDALESAGDGTLRKIVDVAGVRASLAVGTGNSQVLFTANQIGADGNDITIEYLAATAATATVTVTGNAIVIKPDSTTPGTTDLASTVIALVNADAAAQALVVASVGAGDGSGAVVSPVAETNLAGGIDTSGPIYPVAFAKEAVDNSGGSTVARINVRIF